MNAKDEGNIVKRGSGDNRKIWAGTMERPSFRVQAPWRLSFDTLWHHHMGKRPLKPQLKLLSLCHSRSAAWERSIKSMCCPLGLKTHHCSHWGEKNDEPRLYRYTSSNAKIERKLNYYLECAVDANTFTYVSLSVLCLRDELLLACCFVPACYFFLNLCQSTGERWADERKEKAVNSTRKGHRGKTSLHMLDCRK